MPNSDLLPGYAITLIDDTNITFIDISKDLEVQKTKFNEFKKQEHCNICEMQKHGCHPALIMITATDITPSTAN